MPSMTHHQIRLSYEQVGRGPRLVLLHGLGCNHTMWEPLIPHLKESFTILAIDLRGSGESDKPKAPYALEDMTDDVAACIQTMCTQAVSVLGFSLGGLVGMDLAARRPELVSHLILVSTLACWNSPFPPPTQTQELFHETEVSAPLLTQVYETIFGSAYREKISANDYIAFRLGEKNPQPLDAYLHQLQALEKADVRDRLARISAPTLIVAGSEDRVVPPQNASWLQQQIRGSTLKTFEHTGHMLPLEQPQLLADILQEEIKPIS